MMSSVPAPPLFSTLPPDAPAPAMLPRTQRGAVVAFIVLAAVATYHARRAVPMASQAAATAGFKTTATGIHERWRLDTLHVTLDGSLDRLGGASKDAVRAAIGTWLTSGALVPPVQYDDRSDVGQAVRDGVNRVIYAPITVTGHEHDLAVTVSYTDASGEIVEADIIVNSTQKWGLLVDASAVQKAVGDTDEDALSVCAGRFDLQNVVTHEAGHFFGLGEDMTDSTATMYYTSQPCETHKRELTATDRSVMTKLYDEGSLASTSALASGNGAAASTGTSAQRAAGCAARIAPSPAAPAASLFASVAALVALVVRRRRRESRAA